jgi:hypothetical protein
MNWRHCDEWKRDGRGFRITVVRWTVNMDQLDPGKGPHRWAVYAYICPGHPLFRSFSGSRLLQDAAISLPLHGGPSFLRWHRDDDGNPTSIQVGADYNHLGDGRFSHYATHTEAIQVFNDADRLFEHLAQSASEGEAKATERSEEA